MIQKTFIDSFKRLKPEDICTITLKETSIGWADDTVVACSESLETPKSIEHYTDFFVVDGVGYEGKVLIPYTEIRTIKLKENTNIS